MKIQTGTLILSALLSIINHAQAAQEEVFLGVSARKVDSTMRAQLDLPEGIGLAVSSVVPGSPAEGKIQPDDILTKFEKQLLINPEQLGVLVKSHQPGDKVELEYLRKSKKGVTEVALGKRPKSVAGDLELPSNIQILGPTIKTFTLGPDGVMPDGALNADAIKKLITGELGKIKGDQGAMTPEQISNIVKGINIDMDAILKQAGGDNQSFSSHSTSTVISSIMVDEESGATLTYTRNGDKATLNITDKKGDTIFNKPVSTEEEISKIPQEYRKTFDQLSKIESVSSGDGTAVIKSFGTGSGSVNIKVQSETH